MINKKTCQCPNPPGGSITCEADQLGICRVQNGVIEAECMYPPQQLERQRRYDRKVVDPYLLIQYLNWVLNIVTRSNRPLNTPLDQTDRDILKQKNFYNPNTREETSFTLPHFLLIP